MLAYLCHFPPEREGGLTVTCPKLPLVVTFGESLEEPQANAREAIELCLEVCCGLVFAAFGGSMRCSWTSTRGHHPQLGASSEQTVAARARASRRTPSFGRYRMKTSC